MEKMDLMNFMSVSKDEEKQMAKPHKTRKPSVSRGTAAQIFFKYKVWGRLEVTGSYDIPVIKPYEVYDLPNRFVPFHKAMSSKQTDCIVHFFLDDALFARIFRNPDKYVEILKRYRYVITPDLSELTDMPYFMRLGLSGLNRTWAAYWQSKGVNIILNLTWSLHDSYAYSFDGIPKGLVVAISSLGVRKSNFCTSLWLDGYKRVLEQLEPSLIIRYGEKIPSEREDISIYFDNEHLNRMRNGK
ncbi:MAG: DUF4417 domain-containing protein [Bacteroidales bacterium]|nr:DUF4417 domain-containing protein [Bacteroidales bacterium]